MQRERVGHVVLLDHGKPLDLEFGEHLSEQGVLSIGCNIHLFKTEQEAQDAIDRCVEKKLRNHYTIKTVHKNKERESK